MPDAEDEESKTGRGNLTEGRGKVEDGEPLPGPKVRNQDHRAIGRGQPPRRLRQGRGQGATVNCSKIGYVIGIT